MNSLSQFEKIRPYLDDEVNPALMRIGSDKLFLRILMYLFPESKPEDFIKKMTDIYSVKDFQVHFMYNAIKNILKNSSEGMTASGFNNLDKEKGYLFISNHRDIFLDSAILQVILHEYGLNTSYITYGNNLVETPFFGELGKLNKTIVVFRDGSRREIYNYSKLLSQYIKILIAQEKSSVWVSQRNGRTKDGHDKTQMAILKMLNISDSKDLIDELLLLNITPVSISYEYEPCDILKVKELYVSKYGEYVKSKNEDLQSILAGIKEYKGRIHFAAGYRINDELIPIRHIAGEIDKFKAIAQLIDRQIYTNYKLWPNNFISEDLLKENNKYHEFYTPGEKEKFLEYIDSRLKTIEGDYNILKKMFLKMYAYPVHNYYSAVQ